MSVECNLCKQTRPLDAFVGRKKVCQECQEVVSQVNAEQWICCVYCGMTGKEMSRSNMTPYCRDCSRAHVLDSKSERHHRTYKEYYEKNRDKIVAKSKKWNQDNKEKYYAHKKAYRERHKDEIDFRIKENLGTRLRNLVKKDGTHFIDFLGCKLDYFKDWLQFNMKEEMSWENYGSYWHIDHVTPCASFDASNMDEVKTCWNWSNLVPLEASLNCAKIDKIDVAYIEYYNNRKHEYLQLLKQNDLHVQRTDDNRQPE